MKKYLIILFIIFFIVSIVSADIPCPVCSEGDGTGWFTEFNVSNENTTWWGGANTSWTFNSPSGIAESSIQSVPVTFLGNRSLNGTFIWNVRMFNNTDATGTYLYLVFGAQGVDSGDTASGVNKYYLNLYYEPGWSFIYLYKRAGGSNTQLASKNIGWNEEQWYNITVQWEPGNTTKIIVKRDNLNIFNSNDATYISGYAGFGTEWVNTNKEQIENVSFAYQPSVGGGPVAPVADFSCLPRNLVRMNMTNCDDLSTNTPTSWLWYGKNCIVNSTSENPILQFGNYSYCNLCLQVTNAGGTDNKCVDNYIYILQPWAGYS